MQTPTVSSWLEEGMRHYSAGDPARALESWYRILEVEPQHPAALQYVSFVRQAFRLDVPKAEASALSSAAPAPAAPAAPTPAPSAAPAPAPAAAAAPPPVPLDDDEVMPPPAPGLQKPRTPTPPPMTTTAPPTTPTTPATTQAMTPSAPTPTPPTPVHASSWGDLIGPAPVSVQVPPTPGVQLSEGAVKNVRRFGEDFGNEPPPSREPSIRLPPSGAPPLEERPPARQSIRYDEPGAALTLTPAHGSPVPQPLVEAGVVKQSIRFDEPRAPTPAAAPVAAASLPHPPTTTTAPPPPASSASPWDEHEGPAVAVDVDVANNSRATAFESLLKRASGASVPPVEIARPLPSATELSLPPTPTPAPTPAPAAPPAAPTPSLLPPPTTNSTSSMASPTSKPPTPPPAPPPDECEALMTGARELFELGDFSGSLELVEKVLKKQPTHEGARAYLKRNEQTLLKMYESKLGDMQKVPRQLVPPDEVIWMNMHHRAGFILSQVDGSLSYDDLLSVSGMDRFDTVRILADLVGNGIIG